MGSSASTGITQRMSIPFLFLFLCRLNTSSSGTMQVGHTILMVIMWQPSDSILSIAEVTASTTQLLWPNSDPSCHLQLLYLWKNSFNSSVPLVTITSYPYPSVSPTLYSHSPALWLYRDVWSLCCLPVLHSLKVIVFPTHFEHQSQSSEQLS